MVKWAILLLLLMACNVVEDVEEVKPAEPGPVVKTTFCGDGACDLDENKCSCAQDCGMCSGNVTNTTGYSCVAGDCKITTLSGICGNNICEEGESNCKDCPNCNDKNVCTLDSFDGDTLRCKHEIQIPCCGNGLCEDLESLSCLSDCPTGIDLSYYPKPFVQGEKLNALIIVGEAGGSELVLAGINIVRGLTFGTAMPGYTINSQLDTEVVSIADKNVILIGNPCHNYFVRNLYGKSMDNCLEGLSPGDQIIELFKTGEDTYALVLNGYEGKDIRQVSVLLEKYNETNLTGTKVTV